jgi:hypothetical protein
MHHRLECLICSNCRVGTGDNLITTRSSFATVARMLANAKVTTHHIAENPL